MRVLVRYRAILGLIAAVALWLSATSPARAGGGGGGEDLASAHPETLSFWNR